MARATRQDQWRHTAMLCVAFGGKKVDPNEVIRIGMGEDDDTLDEPITEEQSRQATKAAMMGYRIALARMVKEGRLGGKKKPVPQSEEPGGSKEGG